MRNEDGQGFMEYSLIIVIVAIGMVIIVYAYGQDLKGIYQFLMDKLLPIFTG